MTANSTKAKRFEDIIKLSDLINQAVIDSITLEELGHIEVLWMYPQINRVLGFICKSGFLGSKKAAFKLPQIESTGQNGILVRGDGEPTVAVKVKQLESLIQSEVWNDSGEKVGRIIDCLFNYRSGVIVRYLMVPGRLASITDGVYFLPPKAIKSFGQNRVLISAEAASALKPYRKGWKYKLAEMRDTVKSDYIDEMTDELRSFAKQIQLFSKDAIHRVEDWGDRIRDETKTFVEQTRERSQTLYEKARTSGQAIFEQIRTEGLSFNDHMQDTESRTGSDIVHGVSFPEDDIADESSGQNDYDRENWDDEWNDWEDEQDALSDEWDDWSDSDISQTTPNGHEVTKPVIAEHHVTQPSVAETNVLQTDTPISDTPISDAPMSNTPMNDTPIMDESLGDRSPSTPPNPSHSSTLPTSELERELDIWDDGWVDEDIDIIDPLDASSQSNLPKHSENLNLNIPPENAPSKPFNQTTDSEEEDDLWI